MMQLKPIVLAAAMATACVAAPASAALQTLNFTGRWLDIYPMSGWALTDGIHMNVTYDDTALVAGFTDRYDLTAAGSDLTLSIGAESWTLPDYFASFQPVPYIDFSPPTGPEVFFLGISATPTAAIIGIDLLPYGYLPGTILVSPVGDAFAAFSSVATFLPATSVPEPASWALLIAGFGLTGAVLRRRRIRVAT